MEGSEENDRLSSAHEEDDELDADELDVIERLPLSIQHDQQDEYHRTEPSSTRRICLVRCAIFWTVQVFVVALALAFLFQHNSLKNYFNNNQKGQPVKSSSLSSLVDPKITNAFKASSTVQDLEFGAVASDHPVCSQVGNKILRDDGGNAVDAAIATTLCLGVANPASSGMGGGAFILVHVDRTEEDPSKRNTFIDARNALDLEENHGDKVTELIDCREIAPAAANTNMFRGKDKEASTWGGLAIAVPGELRGLELAHSRHGILPWAAVVEPAMKLARDGVPVSAHLAQDIPDYWNWNDGLLSVLTKNNDGESMLEEGDIMTQPALADTLEAVMKNGAKAIYSGYRAVQIARDIQKAGGIVTVDDLHTYRPTLRSPLVARDVDGFTLVGAPPPSSGGAAIIGAARFLAGYKQESSGYLDALWKHRVVEAMRHAFSIRMSLSDPAFNPAVNKDAVNDLVHGSYMEWLRHKTLDDNTLPLSQYGGEKWAQLNDDDVGDGEAKDAEEGDRRRRRTRGFGYLNDHGTSHLSVVDKDRNAVAITSSVNTLFGSGVVSQTGIFLNSQMDDFATPGRANYFGLQPSESNYIKPRKKPLSSMSPTLVFRHDKTSSGLGEFFMALGGSGGPKIITAVLQTFLNHARDGMPLFESMASPRLHDQLVYHNNVVTLFEKAHLGDGLKIEVPHRIRRGLEQRGHAIHSVGYTGCVQAIAMDPTTKRLSAVSDIRKGGTPAGY